MKSLTVGCSYAHKMIGCNDVINDFLLVKAEENFYCTSTMTVTQQRIRMSNSSAGLPIGCLGRAPSRPGPERARMLWLQILICQCRSSVHKARNDLKSVRSKIKCSKAISDERYDN
ncbi:hypothetical protein TNCV_3234391 [Trichonephila clavipes]|nr:hypothetical protein TNCV_3234391 [Trichonephila clavipes]